MKRTRPSVVRVKVVAASLSSLSSQVWATRLNGGPLLGFLTLRHFPEDLTTTRPRLGKHELRVSFLRGNSNLETPRTSYSAPQTSIVAPRVRLAALELDFHWGRSKGECVVRRKAERWNFSNSVRWRTHGKDATCDGDASKGSRGDEREKPDAENNWSDHSEWTRKSRERRTCNRRIQVRRKKTRNGEELDSHTNSCILYFEIGLKTAQLCLSEFEGYIDEWCFSSIPDELILVTILGY